MISQEPQVNGDAVETSQESAPTPVHETPATSETTEKSEEVAENGVSENESNMKVAIFRMPQQPR